VLNIYTALHHHKLALLILEFLFDFVNGSRCFSPHNSCVWCAVPYGQFPGGAVLLSIKFKSALRPAGFLYNGPCAPPIGLRREVQERHMKYESKKSPAFSTDRAFIRDGLRFETFKISRKHSG